MITINGREISPHHAPYIVAEMSANHNGKLENAFILLEAAKRSGAHAVKLQTYTADTITLNSNSPDFCIEHGLWAGKTLHQLYEEAHTPWEWHKPLFEKARQLDLTLFSSPFDSSAVDLLEDLNAPAYKIASFEMIDLPLVHYVAQTGKPVIVSTGMACEEEIAETVDVLRSAGGRQGANFILLQCVSSYPAPAEDYQLRVIPRLAERFGCLTGLSDHTLTNTAAIAAVALGAVFIEKHFTLNRNGGGPDDSFSLEPVELAQLCQDTHTVWQALGAASGIRQRAESETANLRFRRSLYVCQAIKKGERLTQDHVRSVRPGFGLPPKYLPEIIGRRVVRDLDFATPLTWHDLDGGEPHGRV